MKTIPRSALWLGLAGLIPFWAPVLVARWSVAQDRSPAAEALAWTFYAGLILSFLGGVRWGAEIQRDPTPSAAVLVASVAPSVIALGAGVLHWAGAPILAWAGLSLSLIGMLFWDRLSVRALRLPAWYGDLRVILTSGAVLSAAGMTLVRLSG